jgi:hypothetical protein
MEGQIQLSAKEIFMNTVAKRRDDHEAVQAKLYEEVGRLKMELDWVKKNAELG